MARVFDDNSTQQGGDHPIQSVSQLQLIGVVTC